MRHDWFGRILRRLAWEQASVTTEQASRVPKQMAECCRLGRLTFEVHGPAYNTRHSRRDAILQAVHLLRFSRCTRHTNFFEHVLGKSLLSH